LRAAFRHRSSCGRSAVQLQQLGDLNDHQELIHAGGGYLSRIEAKPERPSGVDEDICSCRLTEHDPERPWIVLSQDHRTVTLDDDVTFFEWAHEQWPSPRWTVELDPWQIAPAWP